jgi:signal transduction histidine kinase/CheY-like chemotaxis protein
LHLASGLTLADEFATHVSAPHAKDFVPCRSPEREPVELRVLIHGAQGGEAESIGQALSGQAIRSVPCDGPQPLLAAMDEGAAAAVLTEESLPALLESGLSAWLERQAPWSDFPFLVLAARSESRSAGERERFERLGNVVLLERPLNAEMLASAARAAVRARRRQYAARQQLVELDGTRSELETLNRELEERIGRRTRELARANDRLMKEIAERERAQAALTQVQKLEAIGRLTGGIAHDFNNLLHVINMNLELVSLYAKEEKVKPVVDRAKSAAKRGSKLTNQLLSFARSQSLLPRLTQVNKLLTGMKDLVEVSVGSGVEVQYALGEELPGVVLDTSQLEMAVLNLAVNSRDAMSDEPGQLTIATERRRIVDEDGELKPGEYVVVRVSDTGRGIPPGVLPKVFDPFFTTKPVGSGTGLGLSQVYGFARQSGGLATIRSEPGQGATVEMIFPAADPDTPISLEPPRPALQVPVAKSGNILVVEDDADVRRVIVECLGLIGYSVTEAPNGAEGLAAISRAKPDVLVVDYAMPDMTGAEVISKARELVGDLPVILATGYADMAAVERLAGRPAILRKPFDITTLGDAVAGVLQKA